MKRRLSLGSRRSIPIVATCVLMGCHTAEERVTPAVLVGYYTLVSTGPEGRDMSDSLNHLLLRANGTYDLVEPTETGAASEKQGAWRIMPGTPPNVLLGQAGYPIDINNQEVRLLVDLDIGIWWVKRK